MKICVLQSDYSTTSVDYKNYDPPRDLTNLLPEAVVDHVFLNKLTTYKQLKELSLKQYDCFVNLCEGYLDWEIPSVDVIHSLELLGLPYTGPTPQLYDPPKEVMKYVAYSVGVASPEYVTLDNSDKIAEKCKALRYPLFVKPAHAGDSRGVDEDSFVIDDDSLITKVRSLFDEFHNVLVEEYIDGREFTVLVAASPHAHDDPTAYAPVEYVFPKQNRFKTYRLKTSELHPEANILCTAPEVCDQLKTAAKKIFEAFGGVGYARLDFRMDAEAKIFFLDINFACSVFYSDGYEGSADYVLKLDGAGQSGFLRQIVAEGIARHKRTRKKYQIRGTSISGFGIYARNPIAEEEVIFHGEEADHRLVSKRFVDQHWNPEEKKNFRHYAFPLCEGLYEMWDRDPIKWAPQNHSCSPNTAYRGLDVIALADIAKDEELTLDYSTILDESAEEFRCECGAANCRGVIRGENGNSFSKRESKK